MENAKLKRLYIYKFKLLKNNIIVMLNFNEELNFTLKVYSNDIIKYTLYRRF